MVRPTAHEDPGSRPVDANLVEALDNLPRPWSQPEDLGRAIERAQQRVQDIIDAHERGEHDPAPEGRDWGTFWKTLIGITFVIEIISRVVDRILDYEFEREIERSRIDWREGKVTSTQSLNDFVWFFKSTTFTTPKAWAVRVGDPMLHGGLAGPGPGSPTVKIGGLRALRAGVDAAMCPHATPQQHGTAPFVTANRTVRINGKFAIRVGDYIVDTGGNNPAFAGCPTVTLGVPPPPVDVSVPVKKMPRVTTETYRGAEGRVKWRGVFKLKLRHLLNPRDAIKHVEANYEREETSWFVERQVRDEIVKVSEARDLEFLGFKMRVYPHQVVRTRRRSEKRVHGVKFDLGGTPPVKFMLPMLTKKTINELPEILPRF